jgi:hypothetical protein
MNQCKDCRYYSDSTCIRYPPVPVALAGTAMQPKVKAEREACGEFKS